jgi:hypothetical protein
LNPTFQKPGPSRFHLHGHGVREREGGRVGLLVVTGRIRRGEVEAAMCQ